MINISQEQEGRIKLHILEQYPKEACGLLSFEEYIPLNNVSSNPENFFSLNMEEYCKYLVNREELVLIHSHTLKPNTNPPWDIRTPSLKDLENQKKLNIPWLIYGTDGINVTPPISLPRAASNDYIGRPFLWFINDCWTLVQDYYRFEFGIKLKDSKPPADFKRLPCLSGIFDDKIEGYGFKKLPFDKDLRNGDLLLVDYLGYTKNHLGIYHKGKLLHQASFSVLTDIEQFLGHIHCKLRYMGEVNGD